MSARPTLHEIAEMPFPASMLTMRKHYNKDWHKPEEDGERHPWKVRVNYSVRSQETRTYQVEAATREEAEKLAEGLFDADKTVPYGPEDEIEVDDVDAEMVA